MPGRSKKSWPVELDQAKRYTRLGVDGEVVVENVIEEG